MQAAQVRAEEMAASGVYSHTRPDGRKNTTVTDCPYTGENIHCIADWATQGKTVSEVAVWSWNLSDGHQKNPLNQNYAEIGVGLARGVNDNGDECWYCVQLFLWDGYTQALLGCELMQFSVSAGAVAGLKKRICDSSREAAKSLFAQLEAMKTAEEITRKLSQRGEDA